MCGPRGLHGFGWHCSSHMPFCSRITEVLRLRASDFKWIYVAALKRCPGTQKHMMKATFPELRQLREQGARKRRHRRWSARAVVHFWDSWTWPESEGLLFKSSRCDSHLVRRNKDTAAKAVARLRQSFDPPKKNIVNAQRIRTHSARHTMINNFKDAPKSPTMQARAWHASQTTGLLAILIIFRALCACTEVQCLSTLSYTKRVLSKPSKWVT